MSPEGTSNTEHRTSNIEWRRRHSFTSMFDVFRVLILTALMPVALVRGDELADKGREILNKNQHAVITVQIVSKLRISMPGMGSEASEFKQDLTGTVIDPSGLTVLSLTSCEPDAMFESMMSDMGGESDSKVKMNTELSDVKLLMDDGTEVPADIVLRDKDLDLAFIKPKSRPSTPFAAVDLKKSGRAKVLDQVITLNRLGESAGRAYAASVERISAVVQKPRLFYVPGTDPTSTALGSPAFVPDGSILGVLVMRSVHSKGGGSGFAGFQPDGLTAIILPAEEILKAARQALDSRGDGEKKGESKESKESKDATGKK
jgi:hypothetical protein